MKNTSIPFSWFIQVMRTTRKHKRYGSDSVNFEYEWPVLLIRFMDGILNGEFTIEEIYAFLVSYPKWREIFAVCFEGRMADHILCDTLKPYVELELHDMTFNNREGKGSQAAINQVIDNINEASRGNTQVAWIIKWDLKGFFPNSIRSIMREMFEKIIFKYADAIISDHGEAVYNLLLYLARICVESDPARHCTLRSPWHMWGEHIEREKSLFYKPPGIGVPIGRMSSQMGMGLYINDEVKWLNDECGVPTVVFMDDGVMVVPDERKDYALSLIPELRRRLGAKGVRLNDKKFYCQQHWKGLEFLGSHIKPNTIILNDATYYRAMERIHAYNNLPVHEKFRMLDRFISTINSYTGLLKTRTSYHRLCKLRDAIGADWWQWLLWDDVRQCVVSKPEHQFAQRIRQKYHLKIRKNEKSRNHRTDQRPMDYHS